MTAECKCTGWKGESSNLMKDSNANDLLYPSKYCFALFMYAFLQFFKQAIYLSAHVITLHCLQASVPTPGNVVCVLQNIGYNWSASSFVTFIWPHQDHFRHPHQDDLRMHQNALFLPHFILGNFLYIWPKQFHQTPSLPRAHVCGVSIIST